MNNINNDLISRQQAVDALETVKTVKAENGELYIAKINAQMKLEILSSVQPDIIRCKDCIYQTESWSGIKYCEAHGDHIGKDYDYCSNARRKENG